MKLLRDFFRPRTAGRSTLAGRRDDARRTFTVTVPQPLNQPAEQRAPIDTHLQVENAQGRLLSRWHEHQSSDATLTSRHLHLVSSHS